MRGRHVVSRGIRNNFLLGALLVCAFALGERRLNAATQAPFKVIHSFTGGANDGAMPTYGTSLAASGSTLYGVTQSGGPSTNGVLFKISTGGSGFSVLHAFNGYTIFLNPAGSKNDGAMPTGTPVLVGSTLYGMTTQGGSNGFGTLYKIGIDGSGFQILHHFANTGGDGYLPQGSLTLDGSTLYGMTASGGSNFSQGVVFRIETSGDGYQILHHFVPGANDGASAIGSPIVSGSKVYGMTQFGGSSGVGVLWSVNTNGTGYQILHPFTGTTTDGSHPYDSLLLDGTTLYGMTSSGGANNVGAIFRIETSGAGFAILHSFALNEGWQPFGNLTLANSKLYGMTHSGGAGGLGGGVLFQLNPDGREYQVLHTFTLNGMDGSIPFGSLKFAESALFGVTSLGGAKFQGCVFAYKLGAGGGSGDGGTAVLSGAFSKFKELCKTRRGALTCTLTAFLTAQNGGTAASSPTHLRYFLSADNAFDNAVDVPIGEKVWPRIKPGKSKKLRVKTKTTESTVGMYLLAVDDANAVFASAAIAP